MQPISNVPRTWLRSSTTPQYPGHSLVIRIIRICMLIIQGSPSQYKAVFPHFITYGGQDAYVPGYTSKVHHCPMLSHLPREARVKFINQLTSYCLDCLKPQDRCTCSRDSRTPGLCNDSGKLIYICGHKAAENTIEFRKQKYNAIYQEIQSQHFPKDLIGPKVSQKTSTIYALFSKTITLLPHQWQQEALQPDHFQQTNHDLNFLC